MLDTNAPDERLTQFRASTPARIALGRRGVSVPSASVLAFNQAHALARDAVHAVLDTTVLQQQLRQRSLQGHVVTSRANGRAAYLARPDWGRRLNEASRKRMSGLVASPPTLVIVASDGLSAAAVQRHAVPLVAGLHDSLSDLLLAPVVIATQARVALADEVGECLGAQLALSLIGERPGLSAPDSLGGYLTWAPRVGRTDAQRYCVSNIRPEGLVIEAAVAVLTRLIRRSLGEQHTGIGAPAA